MLDLSRKIIERADADNLPEDHELRILVKELEDAQEKGVPHSELNAKWYAAFNMFDEYEKSTL